MSVAEAQESIDSVEFARWNIFSETEPWGQEWQQTGQLSWLLSILISCWSKGGQHWTPEDFMPISREAREEAKGLQSAEEQQLIFRMIAEQ